MEINNYIQINPTTKEVVGTISTSNEITDDPNYISVPELPIIDVSKTYQYIDGQLIETGTNTAIKIKAIEDLIQNMLNEKAIEHGYDSIISVCSYAGYTNQFQDEAVAFGIWRSDVWAYCYAELEKIQQGVRSEPTIDEFLLELPQINLQGN